MGETNELDYENLLHALASREQCPDTQAWLSVGRGFGLLIWASEDVPASPKAQLAQNEAAVRQGLQ